MANFRDSRPVTRRVLAFYVLAYIDKGVEVFVVLAPIEAGMAFAERGEVAPLALAQRMICGRDQTDDRFLEVRGDDAQEIGVGEFATQMKNVIRVHESAFLGLIEDAKCGVQRMPALVAALVIADAKRFEDRSDAAAGELIVMGCERCMRYRPD
jgi:hypothetical protein